MKKGSLAIEKGCDVPLRNKRSPCSELVFLEGKVRSVRKGGPERNCLQLVRCHAHVVQGQGRGGMNKRRDGCAHAFWCVVCRLAKPVLRTAVEVGHPPFPTSPAIRFIKVRPFVDVCRVMRVVPTEKQHNTHNNTSHTNHERK